jgi:hypothetical protein
LHILLSHHRHWTFNNIVSIYKQFIEVVCHSLCDARAFGNSSTKLHRILVYLQLLAQNLFCLLTVLIQRLSLDLEFETLTFWLKNVTLCFMAQWCQQSQVVTIVWGLQRLYLQG